MEMKTLTRVFLLVALIVSIPASAQGWSAAHISSNAVTGTTTGAGTAWPGQTSTSVLVHIYSASSSSATIAIEHSLDNVNWYTDATSITNPTSTGELWECPAAPYVRTNITAHASGTITSKLAFRSLVGDRVYGCKKIDTATGFTFATGTGTFAVQTGKSATLNGSITLTGTDAQTYTLPTTTATIARTDAANTFTGTQTVSSILAANKLQGLGTTPTTDAGSSTCGTTAPSIAGKDSGGQITVGSVSGTVCHVNFGTAFTNAPACVANGSAATNLKVTTTTAAATITGTLTAGEILQFVCIGF
jgi:hypothetical protein